MHPLKPLPLQSTGASSAPDPRPVLPATLQLKDGIPPSKLFAVGDIHGCYFKLLEALSWIESVAPDGAEVVFLGDLVDRGAHSREVVEHIMKGPSRAEDLWITIKGNHEAMMLEALDELRLGPSRLWGINGGDATMASYGGTVPPEHIEWLRARPLYHETQNHWFVHAGLMPDTHPEDEDEQTLLWMRNWERYKGKYARHVVYGHTPSSVVGLLPHCTCLDTGACYGGPLTCAEFDRYSQSGPIALQGFGEDHPLAR